MQSWTTPFIYAAVMLGIYLLSPEEERSTIQKRIHREINYYIISDLVLVALAIVSTFAYTQHWLKWMTWGALVVTLYLSVQKALTKDARADRKDELQP